VKERKKRSISREGRQRMATAGAQNLARWKAQAPSRANELQAQVDTFRADLLRDAGANLSTSKLGLVEVAATAYASILIVRSKLVHSRKADVATLTERISWAGSLLARTLKTLNLDTKPRPRSLADIVALKPTEVAAKSTV
jgi:hypothetical protein